MGPGLLSYFESFFVCIGSNARGKWLNFCLFTHCVESFWSRERPFRLQKNQKYVFQDQLFAVLFSLPSVPLWITEQKSMTFYFTVVLFPWNILRTTFEYLRFILSDATPLTWREKRSRATGLQWNLKKLCVYYLFWVLWLYVSPLERIDRANNVKNHFLTNPILVI